MTNNVCNICGANYVFKNGRWVCPACGAYKPEELSNEEVTLLYNAQQQLRLADFDEAESLYRDIIEKYPSNHEGYWGLVLAKYGIKYEQDYNGKMIPTCYAASYESVLRDKNYLRALELCDGDERRYLEEQADKIERIRREWVEQASKEPAYDIFLSYKDTESGTGSERTKDSYEAKELYDELTRLGYRVFFSRESLKGKAGENFEPYIFNALNTAHVMIVYGSRPEFFEATWIKNEWSRFLKRINNGEKQKNALIVVYHDLNPKDLVSPLNRLQGIDRKRLDFSRVLEKYCEKVVSAAKTVIPKIDRIEIGTRTGRNAGKVAKLETVELKRRDAAKSEIKRETVERREIGQYTLPPLTAAEENQLSVANAYLASGNFDDAEKIYSAVLENNPQNGSAIVGLLFTAARSKGFDEFGATGVRNFTSWDRFEKALAFSEAGTSEKLLSAFATEAYQALRVGETAKSREIYSHIENYDSESVSRLRRESCTYVLDLIVKDPDTTAFFIDTYLLYESDTDRYIETLSTVVKRAVKEGRFDFAEKYQKEWLSYAEDEYAPNLAALKIRFRTRNEGGVLDAIENAGEFSTLETVLKGLNAESAARLFKVVSNRVNSTVLSDRGNAEAALGWIRTFFKYDFAERTNTIRELLHAILSSPDARRAEIFDLLLMMSDADEETTYDMYRDFARNVRLAGDFVLADRYYGKAIDVRETEECWKGRLMCHLGVPAAADYPKKISLLSDWTIVETILSLLTPSDRIHFLNKMLEYALAALSIPGNKLETIVSIADKFFSYFPQEANSELTRHLAAFAEKLKELKQFTFAERMYATLLGFDNRNHVAYWGLLQAKLKCRNENELVKQPVPLSDLSEFTNALLAAGSNAEAMQRYIGVQNRQRAWLERVEKRKKAARKLRLISAIVGICAAVALVIAGVVFSIVSYHETESGLKYKRDGEGVSVSAGKYYKSDEVLVIPSESEGLPVVSVKKGGFRGHSEIREVVLPDTLTAIGDEAFAGCTNLESVTFADRSSTVSFVVVPRLASAAPGVGNVALSRLSVIGARAFQGCAKLTEITLPQGLTSIGDKAFADTGLVSVTIPETVVSVGKKVFENCEQLTEIRVVNRDEIPAEWDENWGGNAEEKIVYSLRVLLDLTTTDELGTTAAEIVVRGENYAFPVPGRAGYTFTGWYRDDEQLTDGTGASLSVWAYDDGGTVTPKFSANENTIFFNGNGATSGDTHSQKLRTDETAALNANGFVRDGYTFSGWSLTPNGSVGYIDGSQLTMGVEPSVVLYAVWNANLNTLHFNANGGEGMMQDVQIFTGASEHLPVCSFTRHGYTFLGWATTVSENMSYFDTMLYQMGTESEYSLYAVWSLDTYSITYSLNDGSVAGNPVTYTVLSDEIVLNEPIRAGYTFIGWSGTNLSEPTKNVVISKESTGNRFYNANWEAILLHFDSNGGEGSMQDLHVQNGEIVTLPTCTFNRNEYLFLGWAVEPEGEKVFNDSSTYEIGEGNFFTLYAVWDAVDNYLEIDRSNGQCVITGLKDKTMTVLTIPNGVTGIRSSAFENCTELVSITIPNSVTIIEAWAFEGCTGLTSMVIPESVTVIDMEAFAFCSGLTSVTLGKGIKHLDKHVFEGCSGLAAVYYTGSMAEWCGITFDSIDSNPIYYAHQLYLNDALLTDLVIPDTVTVIKDYSFSGCSSLISVTIPNSVTGIGAGAFCGCTGLTSITIPKSVKSISPRAFDDCPQLISITFQNTIGWYVTRTKGADSGNSVAVGDSSKNTLLFTADYLVYYWYRSSPSVGSTIFFGSYEQGGDSSDGKEPIEWEVLQKHDNRIMVMSKYALDCQPYNNTTGTVSWENCSLRSWLNYTFLNEAFSASELEMIPTTTVTTLPNQLYSPLSKTETEDRVFLLSVEEESVYSAWRRTATTYAELQGVSSSTTYSPTPTCCWWLRNPGMEKCAAYVNDGGNTSPSGTYVTTGYIGVCPVIWICLD